MHPSEPIKTSEPSTPVSCEEKPPEPLRTFHEPDVIASTKCPNSGIVSIETDRPVAPPRRRRRKQINSSIENDGAKIEDNSNVQILLNYEINRNIVFIFFYSLYIF